MRNDDLDKILLSEKRIEASPLFAANVMARIEAEGSMTRRGLFQYVCFALATAVLMIAAVRVFPAKSVLYALNSATNTLGQWIIAPPDIVLWNAFAAALGSVLGTMLLIWLSLRLCGARS